MKTYLATAFLTFTLTVSALAQTAGDNNPKSSHRHHTRPPYSGPLKPHKHSHHSIVHHANVQKAHLSKPTSDHVVAH
jgi:hypothetical protein